ncbi:MAG: bifunctional glutamate N-acetyltransferase/amino-acid acetyltransferase ArgJ [Chloroflexi bacterium CFX4]|nr:bifunctional glutamate N-acetyltransferase/amino-acid acetyltransferase ArgJ [Chloroflexi bacterium CFX4]MDL1921579.1 bifunctional glutamate N-acetyltransferase/amino-acid acetyltransferase ArgJ [Chloroflexi bacterium CFX3]
MPVYTGIADLPTLRGFQVGALDAGLYAHFGKPTRPDLTLIASAAPCAAAAVFTTNLVKAAPVLLDQARLAANPSGIRAVLINTASANACTGERGYANAVQSAAWTAAAFGCAEDQVLVMSTGVIGTQLPMPRMQQGIAQLPPQLGSTPNHWQAAAQAIMTTDTKPKLAHSTYNGAALIGIAKGAGMIAPNMATMLSVIATDAQIAPLLLQEMLSRAADQSFNRIVVDGDMSTNDTLLILANGTSGVLIDETNARHFEAALTELCTVLAQAIVRDGEGVTKFITLQISGARSAAEARQIGNAIATSPLVKTAFYGGDPNWGRILAAAGRSGIALDPTRLALWYNDLQLVADGTPLNYDEGRAKLHAQQAEVVVRLDLGAGDAESVIWTCDLSHDYVSINGHYRT